ncbi:MAG: zinc-ribbon and DUF3426 domain-containing protein [Gammaproteobacteria bacterium]|nr:zinc-ribbon and DUF3426 domain-containing protein [Gammaproteobacteria bacterium]MCY4337814.1 zinc-ribbon and DUF3426 domain-containing protein [Gammaproteobacteria bacterium]
MFADCPSCGRLFRVRAAQLKAAEGWVSCGSCGETFSALQRLRDAPVLRPHPPLLTEEVAPESALASATPEPAPAQPAPAPVLQNAAEPAPRQQEPEQVAAAPAATDYEPLSDLPPALVDEGERQTGSSTRWVWGALVVILSLTALLQLGWFNRDWLLQRYPAGVPWVQAACERLQCEPIRFRDPSTIALLAKDVQQHPRYHNALLVNAIMVSQAQFVQPFPEIELLIYAPARQLLARGRFTPAQYLGAGIDPAAGMAPEAPVHIALELVGAPAQATSFQLRFY